MVSDVLLVVVLYALGISSQPASLDGCDERWNGTGRLDKMTKRDLCEGSTRRAQGTKPLSAIPV